MTRIEQMLRDRRAPCVDGLYRADGVSRRARVDGPRLSWLEIGPTFDLAAELDNDTLDVDSAASAELPYSGSVCCGEGVLGSDGFFARIEAGGNPLWVVVLTNSNPFVRVDVAGMTATFTNNLGSSVVIDLNDSHLTLPDA